MAKVQIELGGGFHNSPAVVIRVSERDWASAIQSGEKMSALSDGQAKRLQRHFCGIASCTCGGARRADWSVLSHYLTPA